MTSAGAHHGQPLEKWGDWRLSDLGTALERATRLINGSLVAHSVSVYAPGTPDDVPTVHVYVEDDDALSRVRAWLEDVDAPVRVNEDLFGRGFTVQAADVFLYVQQIDAGRP